jgi:hypothetical protein
LKLNPGIERQTFLFDHFGKKVGPKFAETMEQGSKKLKEMNNAVSKNMVLTEENVKAARDYEIAVDDLTDSYTGLKYQLGNKIIPILTQVMKGMENVCQTQDDYNRRLQTVIELYGDHGDRANNMRVLMIAEGETIRSNTTSYTAWAEAMEKADPVYNKTLEDLEAMDVAAKELSGELIALSGSVLSIASSEKALNDQLTENRTKQQELRDEIDLLIGQGWSPYGEKVMDIQQKLSDLKTEEGELTKQFDENSKQRIGGILLEKLELEGLEQTEYELWLQYMIHTGQITQEQANRAAAERRLASEIAGGITTVADADRRFKQILDELNGKIVHTYVENHITTTYQSPVHVGGGGGSSNRASGGPVTGGQSYNVGEFYKPEVFRAPSSGRIEAKGDINTLISAIKENSIDYYKMARIFRDTSLQGA